jgi:hypothetical protein
LASRREDHRGAADFTLIYLKLFDPPRQLLRCRMRALSAIDLDQRFGGLATG